MFLCWKKLPVYTMWILFPRFHSSIFHEQCPTFYLHTPILHNPSSVEPPLQPTQISFFLVWITPCILAMDDIPHYGKLVLLYSWLTSQDQGRSSAGEAPQHVTGLSTGLGDSLTVEGSICFYVFLNVSVQLLLSASESFLTEQKGFVFVFLFLFLISNKDTQQIHY